jgi:hypothetical protein
MPIFTVKVAVRILEIYEIEAENEDEARENWADGSLEHHSDEALDTQVLSVKLENPDE